MVHNLPGDCIAHALSFTSPRDACQSSFVNVTFRRAAESDDLWEKFLPSKYEEIISRSVYPVVFNSKKELFSKLCSPLLIDNGNKAIWLEKSTGKICYSLSARELYIPWANQPLYWSWKPIQSSFVFGEVVELVMTHWLEINGKINTQMLSPNTLYGAYLLIQFCNRAYGLYTMPIEVSVAFGDVSLRRMICLRHYDERKQNCESKTFEGAGEIVCVVGDEWLEIELGEFYSDNAVNGREVNVSLKEIEGVQLKGGLVVGGIEVRPKG